MNDSRPLSLAIIGCGAIGQWGHLPAATICPDVSVTLLVDTDLNHARTLAEQFKVQAVSSDFREALKMAEAAILAVPHYLHFPLACELLKGGMAVLVEKPMAMTSQECREMIRVAQEAKGILAVSQQRRFLKVTRLVRWLLEQRILGKILSFDIRDGDVYRSPVRTDFFFRKESAGGGVLIDTGAHTLDQLLWWLGDVAEVEYYDDNYGGVEADCLLQLKLSCGATGIVELSRTRNLRNTAIIEGEAGKLEVSLRDNSILLHSIHGQFDLSENAPQSFVDLFVSQLQSFVGAVRGVRSLEVQPEQSMRVVEIIEECYRNRNTLDLPWILPTAKEQV